MDSFLVVFFLTTLLSQSQSQPLLLPLTHTLSLTHKSTTLHAHLNASAHLSTLRHRHRQISLPLSPGSDYTLTLTLASQPTHLFLDTGSDLVWLPCHPFECILCENKPPPNPLSNLSTPIPCSSPSCSAAHSSLPISDLCAISGCPLDTLEIDTCETHSCPRFYYAYGDGSLVASLRKHPLSLSHVTIPEFTFGCAHQTLAEPVGVAGFGRGILSLPSQLASLSPKLGNIFSYCLVSHNFDSTRLKRPSPLILGRASPTQLDSFVYTPLLSNPKHPYFYTVGLLAISVGGKNLPTLPELRSVDRRGYGGVVVDSGTTFTMLPRKMHEIVVNEFGKRMEGSGFKRSGVTEEATGLRPCFKRSNGLKVPSLVLHFAGNASVALPRRNYYYEGFGGGKVGCLMVMDGGDEATGPAGTLGNIQQQGFEVVYDVEVMRVGFARRRCGALWEAGRMG